MSEATTVRWLPGAASHVLERKMDSIPFSSYQVLLIFVLGFTGFIEAFDLVMTGSLLVLAKAPLHLTQSDTRWLILGPSMMLVVSGFAFSAVGDRLSRKAMLLIGVISTTFLTLLIPLVQTAAHLIILRTLTGLGAGGVVSAAFPIAAELLPAQHRRTYGAVYEMSLASAFTVVPAVGGLLPAMPMPSAGWPCRAGWRCCSCRRSSISCCRKARAGFCAGATRRSRSTSSTRSSPAAASASRR